MNPTHKLILYGSLGFLGLSLVLPGLVEMFKSQPGSASGLIPETIAANNQLRALNGMMLGIGVLALWACYDLEGSRVLVLIVGGLLVPIVIARLYSVLVDGYPGLMTLLYLAIEACLCSVFLLWPPPGE